NLSRARGAEGLDSLYGYVFGDAILRELATVPFRELPRLLRSPMSGLDDEAVFAEAERRRREAAGEEVERREKPAKATTPKLRRDVDEIVALASAHQLSDLRLLRRMVPEEATVVFVLQPYAPLIERTLSPEEEEIFAGLDLLGGAKWISVRE